MRLYNKGRRNYLLTREFCSVHIETIKQLQNCEQSDCSTDNNCVLCNYKKEEYDLYAKELIITRLYYALMQILYSLVDEDEDEDNPDKRKDHKYHLDKNRVKRLFNMEHDPKQKNYKLEILKDMSEIHRLRIKCDYMINYNLIKFRKHILKIDRLYNALEELRSQ